MPQRSCSVDEHENRRAGLRAQRGVMCSEECDEALEKGGLAAASEGVDDMDRGIGVAHRGQDAPLLLVYDFQRWRQVVQEAIVKYGAQGVAAPLVARRLARNSQSRAGRATQRRLRASQRHERRDGRPGVVQDQRKRLAKVIRGRSECQAACPERGVRHHVQSACLPDVRRGA